MNALLSLFSPRHGPPLFLALLFSLPVPGAASPDPKPLSNPDASLEARAVYDYLCSLRGKAMLSGQQEWENNPPGEPEELKYIQQTTGKLPAILGLDYIRYEGVTDRAIEWWQRGGLPSICWHWGAPTRGIGYEASKLPIDLDEVLTPGSALNQAMMADLDRTAQELTRLRDARVPILWRPLHELNGDWFWWGKGTPEHFKRLWRLMYETYTHRYKLNNLIWVLGYTSKPDPAWYPGDEFVDIAGADNYRAGTQHAMFEGVAKIVGARMPIVYHECGPIPDPDEMIADGTAWSWFLTWHTIHLKKQNTADYLKKIYHHPYVITLDRVPPLTRSGPGSAAR
ncbi:MAG TPA: glycosyl hydrolase [Opitutus sp.]|nr:glycosyl hydrolase [Opitutus sp.]